MHRVAFSPDDLGATDGAFFPHLVGLLVSGPSVDYWSNDLGHDLPGTLNDDHIALPNVLGGDVVRIVQRSQLDGDADTWTGSNTAKGFSAPVRPTFTPISISRVRACSAGYLYATAHRGSRPT